MKTRLSLRYIGPAVDDGLMDVYQASTNMIAFSEFMVAAVKAVYGEQAEAQAEVAAGFGRGSFVTDIVFKVGGPLASLFAAFSPGELLSVIQGAFDLWKHLKGYPPAAVDPSGQTAIVTNNAGQILQVRAESLNLVMSEKAANAVARFVRDAIGHEGVDALEVNADRAPLFSVSRAEAPHFVAVASSVPVSENTVKMDVILVAPVFQEGNKWRFHDGASLFSAAIEDEDFLARVENGERFGKGDVLTVEMRIMQTRSGGRIEAQRIVQRVIEHRAPLPQEALL
ncbi:hypothetical protein [Cupriavidus campinensis]